MDKYHYKGRLNHVGSGNCMDLFKYHACVISIFDNNKISNPLKRLNELHVNNMEREEYEETSGNQLTCNPLYPDRTGYGNH